MYIYILYIHKFTSKYHRLPHPRSRNSQDQETFLAPSADNQTATMTQCSKPPSLSINPKVKGIEL